MHTQRDENLRNICYVIVASFLSMNQGKSFSLSLLPFWCCPFGLAKLLLMALLLLSPVFKAILIGHSNPWVLKSVNMYSFAFTVLCCNTPCLGSPLWDFTRSIFTHLHTDVFHSGLSSDLFFSRKNPTSVPVYHLQSYFHYKHLLSLILFYSNCFLSVSYQNERPWKLDYLLTLSGKSFLSSRVNKASLVGIYQSNINSSK